MINLRRSFIVGIKGFHLTKKEFFLDFKSLSITNRIGVFFSRPLIRQVNCELSILRVFDEIKIPSLRYLNRCENFLESSFVILLVFS